VSAVLSDRRTAKKKADLQEYEKALRSQQSTGL
jgi:hypothetical protein